MLQKHGGYENHPNDTSTNDFNANNRCKSKGSSQIVPNHINDKNEYAKKIGRGRGGAYKCTFLVEYVFHTFLAQDY